MDLFSMSDSQLENYATAVLKDLIKWGNEKNWDRWSAHFHEQGRSEENRKDVERQWSEKPVLCAFKDNFEFIGVVRRKVDILTLWKMWNHTTEDEILGLLGFEIENEQIKVCGYRVT